MLDHERFPTFLEHDGSNAPEVSMYAPAETAPEVFTRPALSGGGYFSGQTPFSSGDDDSPGSLSFPKPLTTSVPQRYCGLKRQTFFVILAIAVVAIISALAGGLGGGLSSRESHDSDEHDDLEPGTDSGSGSGPAPGSGNTSNATITGPISSTQRFMTASGTVGSTRQDIQLFYQHLNTTDIWYQRVLDDEPKDRHNLDGLQIPPTWASPLAASAFNNSDPATTQLFYVSRAGRTTNIVQATIECSSKDDTCQVKSNNIISANVTAKVNPKTKLAAVRLGDDFVRVYYQASNGDVWVLKGDQASTNGWSAGLMAQGAYSGSGIAAYAGPDAEHMVLVYVDSKSQAPQMMRYSDKVGPGLATTLDENPGSGWDALNSIAACFPSVLDAGRVYYANPRNGPILAYFQIGQGPGWKKHTDSVWGQVQGGFAAIGWGIKIRLFYFEQRDLVMSAQNGLEWNDPVTIHDAGDG